MTKKHTGLATRIEKYLQSHIGETLYLRDVRQDFKKFCAKQKKETEFHA